MVKIDGKARHTCTRRHACGALVVPQRPLRCTRHTAHRPSRPACPVVPLRYLHTVGTRLKLFILIDIITKQKDESCQPKGTLTLQTPTSGERAEEAACSPSKGPMNVASQQAQHVCEACSAATSRKQGVHVRSRHVGQAQHKHEHWSRATSGGHKCHNTFSQQRTCRQRTRPSAVAPSPAVAAQSTRDQAEGCCLRTPQVRRLWPPSPPMPKPAGRRQRRQRRDCCAGAVGRHVSTGRLA